MKTIYEGLDAGFVGYFDKKEKKAKWSLNVFQYKIIGDYDPKTNKTKAEISFSPVGESWYNKLKSDFGV